MANETRKEDNKGKKKYKGEYLDKSNTRRKYKEAPENRLRRGRQQREVNYKGSKKEEEVSHVLSGFSLNALAQKNRNLFYQSSFDTSFSV